MTIKNHVLLFPFASSRTADTSERTLQPFISTAFNFSVPHRTAPSFHNGPIQMRTTLPAVSATRWLGLRVHTIGMRYFVTNLTYYHTGTHTTQHKKRI